MVKRGLHSHQRRCNTLFDCLVWSSVVVAKALQVPVILTPFIAAYFEWSEPILFDYLPGPVASLAGVCPTWLSAFIVLSAIALLVIELLYLHIRRYRLIF